MIAGTDGPAVLPADCAGGTLGVRPEHIELALGRGVPAVVQGVEYLGADSLVTCRIGGATVAVRVAGNSGLAAGAVARLAWAPGAQHVFDRDGRRVVADPVFQGATLYA